MALIVGLPALAEAQLFPNMWIQRKRTECANEAPYYGHIRRDYFGYYPTCWRAFPEGWACPCPNPEKPDLAKAFADFPRDPKPELPPGDDDEPMNGPDREAAPGAGANPAMPPAAGPRTGDPNLPPQPGGTRSPFEVDPKRPAVPSTPLDDPFSPSPAAPRAGGSASPLDPIGTPPRSSSNDSVTPPTAPAIAGPTAALGRPRRAPSRRIASSTPVDSTTGANPRTTTAAAASAEPSSPVLALPEIAAPAASLPAGTPPQIATLPSSLPTNGAYIDIPVSTTPVTDNSTIAADPIQAPTTASQPAKAPTRRTSIIGSLFGNRTTR